MSTIAIEEQTYFAGLIFYQVTEDGIRFLVFDYDRAGYRTVKLPGGCNKKNEQPEQTARREAAEEVGADRRHFAIGFFGPVFENQITEDHCQKYFAVREWQGEFRTEELRDGDTILGPPRWVDSFAINDSLFRRHRKAWAVALPLICARDDHFARAAENDPVISHHLRF